MDKIDKDHNNNITKAELRAWMEYIQLKHIDDEVEKRWTLIDTDGDGMISWNEFKQRHYGHKMGEEIQYVLLLKVEVKSVLRIFYAHNIVCATTGTPIS